ncbi:MAG: ATPase, T2SS/T4P/T4SS family [Pseudomonadota bacterium]
MQGSLLAKLPEEIQKRVRLEDGQLFVSEELRGTQEIISFVGYIKRYGVKNVVWVEPKEFDKQKRAFSSNDNEYEDADVQQYARRLFEQAYNENASDIHIIDVGEYGLIRFRRLGLLKDHAQLGGNFTQRLVATIFGTMCNGRSDGDFSPLKRQDGRISERKWLPAGVHSMRVHTEPLQSAQSETGMGTYMPIRLLYDRTKAEGSLEERVNVLGYDSNNSRRFRFLTQRTGLTLISGPTGHGKSTLLKHIMEGQTISNPEKAYISLEDPVEYPMSRVQQVMVSTKTSSDPLQRGRAYMDALAGAMRSDPDVVMIGEIRYPEAASAAIDMALTGHGVWATIHANNGFGIIRRMVSLLNAANYADPLEYLCDHNVIAGLVYQRLLPLLCPHCKKSLYALRENAEELGKFIEHDVLDRIFSVTESSQIENISLWNKDGCKHCDHLGIVGQTVASEVIVTDQKMLEFLRKGQYNEAQDYWENEVHGRTYVQHAIEHICNGLVDPTLAEARLGVPLNFSKLHDLFVD